MVIMPRPHPAIWSRRIQPPTQVVARNVDDGGPGSNPDFGLYRSLSLRTMTAEMALVRILPVLADHQPGGGGQPGQHRNLAHDAADLPRPHPGRHHPEQAIRVPGVFQRPGIDSSIEPACRRHRSSGRTRPSPPGTAAPSDLRAAPRQPGMALRTYRGGENSVQQKTHAK